ncbi:MAG: hypothetical protein KJO80_01760 [Gammaproteobacteria bacterium]|nr:hypothetical protein [Gammaproteobacteria bacterium]
MGERRIYELNYPDFSIILRDATNNKKKIEKTSKDAWKNYVARHNVPEPALLTRGKAGTLSGKVDLVVIEGAGQADGYYVYSADEQFCLKFESGVEG